MSEVLCLAGQSSANVENEFSHIDQNRLSFWLAGVLLLFALITLLLAVVTRF